jgi:hypothetical protein
VSLPPAVGTLVGCTTVEDHTHTKPTIQKYGSLKAVNQKFLRNRRRCVRNDPNIKRSKAL